MPHTFPALRFLAFAAGLLLLPALSVPAAAGRDLGWTGDGVVA